MSSESHYPWLRSAADAAEVGPPVTAAPVHAVKLGNFANRNNPWSSTTQTQTIAAVPPLPRILEQDYHIPLDGWNIFWSQIRHSYFVQQKSCVNCACPFVYLCGMLGLLAWYDSLRDSRDQNVSLWWLYIVMIGALVLYYGWCVNGSGGETYEGDDQQKALRRIARMAGDRLFHRHGLTVQFQWRSEALYDPDGLHLEQWIVFVPIPMVTIVSPAVMPSDVP